MPRVLAMGSRPSSPKFAQPRRPRLTLNGQRLPLERADELALEIEAMDFEGAYSASRVDDLRASSAGLLGAEAAAGVLAADIQVPQRLDRVRVRLVGAVRRATDGERVSLSTPWTVTSVGLTKITTVSRGFSSTVEAGRVICFGVSSTSVVAEFTSRKKTRIVKTSISEVRFIFGTVFWPWRLMRFMRREAFTVRLRSRCW